MQQKYTYWITSSASLWSAILSGPAQGSGDRLAGITKFPPPSPLIFIGGWGFDFRPEEVL
jgi:hypothetical protein